MFSFPSLSKLLVVFAVLTAVWIGFRWLSRLERARKAEVKADAKPKPSATARSAPRDPSVEEMRACPTCGTFVLKGAGRCEKAGCPL